MLNRRHLRVKVLQALYAYHQSAVRDVSQQEKNLLQSIDKVYEMYIWMLSLISEVTNRFVVTLKQNKEFLVSLKKYKVSWDFEPELVKTLFTTLKNAPEYTEYLQKTDDTIHSDKDIIKFIFKKVILKSSLAEQVFEDMFIFWPVDKDVLQALIAKTFKNFAFDEAEKNHLAEVTGNWVEDKEFIVDLFKNTVRYDKEYQEMISVKTQNWEPERIAMMDTLLMKMALAEFIKFNSIPVKVTINEYLEISKEFSTPKSNSFINGILDKILIELKSENKIKKTGRGLIE